MKYRRTENRTVLIVLMVGLCAGMQTSAVMVDDFEQNNSANNTLGCWSAMWVDTDTSAGGLVPDQVGAQKNGDNGGVLYYSNGVAEVNECVFYTVLDDSSPYMDLSADPLYVRFWIKSNEGTPAIRQVRLEGDDPPTQMATVPFADFNGGSEALIAEWKEISIPLSSFLANATVGFTNTQVKALSMTMVSTSSVSGFSSIYIDDIQITNTPAPQAGTVVTDNLLIDSFEQANLKLNTLGYWADVYVDTNTSAAGFLPDLAGAGQNASLGGVVYYSNGVSEVNSIKFYSVMSEEWPYLDLSTRELHVRFWIKGQEGKPSIDHVYLEGSGDSYGRVDFADLNGGSSKVWGGWKEISIPVSNFLDYTSGGFSLSEVKLISFTFDSGSTDVYSSIYLDDILIATNAAPPPIAGTPVTSSLMIDDFEQDNGNPNTLSLWSSVYLADPDSAAGLVPDIGGAQKNGSLGGVMYYSNSVDEASPSKYYTVLATDFPYLDLTETSLYLRFWIKANEGTPAIDKLILEGEDYLQYGQVDFSAYNGGSSSPGPDWEEISIPVTDFAADSAGGFTLTRVSLLGMTFDSESSVDGFSSIYVDDIQLATASAPSPVPDTKTINLMVIDDFEQGNDKPNSLSYWSDVYVDASESFGGFIPDFDPVERFGEYGGVVFYSNSPSATIPPFFYSVISTSWPYADFQDGDIAVQFWIRAGDNMPVVDKIKLEGDNNTIYGQVDFASVNGGSNEVPGDWHHVVVGITNFLADSAGGFRLDRVKVFGLSFDPASSVGEFSSVWIDNIKIGRPDEDDDGMPDDWEYTIFGPSGADPEEDEDFDGTSNLHEYIADTAPTNDRSVFMIDRLVVQSPATVSFLTSTGRLYDVEYSTNLLTGTWTPLISNTAGNGGLMEVVDPDESALHRLYRIGVKLP